MRSTPQRPGPAGVRPVRRRPAPTRGMGPRRGDPPRHRDARHPPVPHAPRRGRRHLPRLPGRRDRRTDRLIPADRPEAAMTTHAPRGVLMPTPRRERLYLAAALLSLTGAAMLLAGIGATPRHLAAAALVSVAVVV